MGKKPTTPMHTWAISRIKGTPAVEIGWVDVPDAETAINLRDHRSRAAEAVGRTEGEVAGPRAEGTLSEGPEPCFEVTPILVLLPLEDELPSEFDRLSALRGDRFAAR
jgi:hypothetical protein